MKTARTKKSLKGPIKNRRQRILAKALGIDRERAKPFNEDDRGEDRRFETSLQGFEYEEKQHEASRYISKTVATVTLSSKGQIVIPREMRTLLNIKPGQRVDVTEKDGVVHIVPIRPSKRETRMASIETPPLRLGKPLNPSPSKMKNIRKTR